MTAGEARQYLAYRVRVACDRGAGRLTWNLTDIAAIRALLKAVGDGRS